MIFLPTTIREIAEMVNVSTGSASTILHRTFGMKKVFYKWVPYLDTMEQKQQRIDDLESCLALFIRNKHDFFTSLGQWTKHGLERNRQSAEWHAADESRLKCPKTQQFVGNATVSVF